MKKRSQLPQYTYRQSSREEERKIYRRIALVCLATLVILVIIYFWGLSFINVLSLLSGGSKSSSNSSSSSSYTLPLQAPVLSSLQSPTNQDKIDIQGTATAGSKVTLTVNGSKVGDQTADAGNFKFSSVSLTVGINQISVAASDSSGATQSTQATVVLDKTPPTLTVNAPADGASFDAKTTSVSVSGTTSDPDGIVFVNTIQATLDPKTGNFSFNLPVQAGQITIEVKAFDQAGNSTSQTRTITVASSTQTGQ